MIWGGGVLLVQKYYDFLRDYYNDHDYTVYSGERKGPFPC